MIDGLKKELLFKYTDEDGDEVICLVGTDKDDDLGFCCYTGDTKLDTMSHNDLEYIDQFHEFDDLRRRLLLLPENERKTIVQELVTVFSEEIGNTIKQIIKNR